jgi:DNA polymerase-3 subunit beta
MFSACVKVKDFINAVKTVLLFIPKQTRLFCLNNIRVTGGGGRYLSLHSSNMDNFCTVEIPIVGDGIGELFVDSKTLLNAVANFDLQTMDIEIDEKLNIKNSDISISINQTINKDEYPTLPVLAERKTALRIKYSTMINILKKVAFTASNDASRVTLERICIRKLEKGIIVGATNGHKLIEYKSECLEFGDVPEILILPKIILSFLSNNVGDIVSIDFLKTDKTDWIEIKSGNATLHSKYQFDVTNKEYPDYEKVLPTDHNKFATFDRLELIKAIKRLNPSANRKTKMISMEFSSCGSCLLTVDNKDREIKINTTIPVDYTGEHFEIAANSIFFLQILDKIKSECVVMAMKEEATGIIFTPALAKRERFLLMPLRKQREY